MSVLLTNLLRPASVALSISGAAFLALSSYVYVVLTGRLLTTADAAVSLGFYFVAIVLGPGVFYAVEQVIGRDGVARRTVGKSRQRTVTSHSLQLLVLVTGIALAAVGVIADAGPADEPTLFLAVLLLPSSALILHASRGLLIHSRSIRAYALSLVGEGGVRLICCLGLVGLGSRDPGAYALAFVAGPLVASVAVLAWLRSAGRKRIGPLNDGGDARPSDVWRLALGTVAAQALPSVAALLLGATHAPGSEISLIFGQAVLIARLPLLLVAPIQAGLLSPLRAAVVSGSSEFQTIVYRTLVVIGVLSVVGMLLYCWWGPEILALVFSAEQSPSRTVLAMLALATGSSLGASVVHVAVVAAGGSLHNTVAWVLGCAVTVSTLIAAGTSQFAGSLGHLMGPVATFGFLVAALVAMTRSKYGQAMRPRSGGSSDATQRRQPSKRGLDSSV